LAARDTDGSARALRQREARSLKFLLVLALLGLACEGVILVVQVMVLPAEQVRTTGLVVFMVLETAGLGVLIYALHRSLWPNHIGLVIALLTSTFAARAAYTLWRGFAADAPLAELATGWPFAAAGTAAIAAMALTLRPLYVAIAGVGALVTLAGIHIVAAVDPGTVWVMGRADIKPALATGARVISIPRVLAELIFVAVSTAAVAYAAYLARRTVREAVGLQRTTDQMSRYFSPDVARTIRDGGDALMAQGPREQDVVVLFSDIVNYSATCASLTPAQAFAMLSEYQERMVAEIFKAGGTLDKFIGDGIMATFGTPEPARDAADRAVRAAQGMIAALSALNEERVARGEVPLAQRIGIHAGPVVVGNVGPPQRLEFGVIGDTVNVAARIEAAGKKTGRRAMMSAAVLQRLSMPVPVDPLGPVSLDGQPAPIELYALR
jgi:adenylate cyclase